MQDRRATTVAFFGSGALVGLIVGIWALIAGKVILGLVLLVLGAICAFTLWSRMRRA